MICSIFAIDANGGLGKNGTLPWPKDSEDLGWFKTNTLDEIVVMGRNTWEDPMMPKPLPKRTNVVIASGKIQEQDRAHILINAGFEISIKALEYKFPGKRIWIIGGAKLLKSTAHLVDKVYLTRFDQVYGCDVTIDIDQYLKNFTMVESKQGTHKRFEVYAKLSGSLK